MPSRLEALPEILDVLVNVLGANAAAGAADRESAIAKW